MRLLVPPRGFQTRNEDGSQFGCFLGKALKHRGGQVFGFGSKAEPELSFIRFLKRNLKFGAKFRFGSGDLRGAVIGCGAGAASSQLRRDSSCSCVSGQGIRCFQASKRESARATYQINHTPFYLFPPFLQTPTFL